MRWFGDEKEPSPFLKALEETRRLATREGWRYQHVQAIIVAIDQYAEAATNRPVHSLMATATGGPMSGMAVLENVRRYRTIASLCRQTAAFRPAQKWTLLAQAYEWERLAMTELEAHFIAPNTASQWEMAAAA
jgi:hypothetical protein